MGAEVPGGITIDADVMAAFSKELVPAIGPLFELIGEIAETYGISTSELLEQEWYSTCGNYAFKQWVSSLIPLGRIRFLHGKFHPHAMKELHERFGFPRRGRDRELIKIANVSRERYILTYDMDFFDPTLKQATIAAKTRARDQRQGALCKHLRKAHSIIVGLPEHYQDDCKAMT